MIISKDEIVLINRFKLNKINKKLKVIEKKYKKWEKNATWYVQAIEINPLYSEYTLLKKNDKTY